jgi:hypothetical protein
MTGPAWPHLATVIENEILAAATDVPVTPTARRRK